MPVRDWAPDIDRWPRSWMGVREDLEYGKRLLPYLEEFLKDILDGGMSRKTFNQYRDNAWLLGETIISKVSLFEEYGTSITIPELAELIGITERSVQRNIQHLETLDSVEVARTIRKALKR